MLKLLLLTGILLCAGISRAQCPAKDSLLKRLVIPADADSAQLRTQLEELKKYEVTIRVCPYRTDSIHAELFRSIRRIYVLQEDYIRAAQYAQRLITFITKHAGKPHVSEADVLQPYYWLSNYYDSLHNITGKMRAIDSCVTIALRLNISSDISCIRSLYTRVEYFFDKGDYHRCIRDATLCERMALSYAESPSTPPVYRSTGYYHAFSSTGWYVNAQLALKNYDSLEQYITERIDLYKAHDRKNYLGVVYAQLAEVQWSKGNNKEAIRYYNQSLNSFRQTGDRLRCKQTLNSLGHDVYYNILRDDEKALSCYTQALNYKTVTEGKEDSAESLNILSRIANVYVRKNNFNSAFFYFRRAFDQVRPGADEVSLLNASLDEKKSFKKVHYLASLVMDKGYAYLQKYKHGGHAPDLAEAIRIYKVADALLNSIKAEQSETSSKLFWRYDTRRLYENAIEACLLQDNMPDAFYFFEKSRATLLNDQLEAQHWFGNEDIALMAQVQKRLAQIDRAFDTVSNPGLYDRLSLERAKTINQLYNLNQVISERNPLYYRNIVDTTSVSLYNIQDTLRKKNQSLLEIFAGDSAVYSLLVTAGSVELNRIDKKLYDSLTSLYIAYTKDPVRSNTDFATYRNTSYSLYKLIFGDEPPPKGRIIISPDGSYFPFEALITTRSGDVAYFVKDYAVSYTYSTSYLQNSFSSGKTEGEKFLLGVAPVSYAPHLKLVSLTGSDVSLKSIKRFYGGYLGLVGPQASRDKFLGSFSDYRIVQLYTHASDSSADSSGHNEPVIYFADAPLYLSELIPQGRPATQLIVLSACETAGGREYRGEGVFSFNRGFAAMGIPSSITNLWAVENEPTYKLTELFYQYMSEGFTLDVALQKAKLTFLEHEQETLPYFWAAAIMMGKTDRIPYEKPTQWIWVALLAASAVPAFILFRKYRKKN